MNYIPRDIEANLHEHLQFFPVTAILGPRQSGKTTLVREYLRKSQTGLFLDLQKDSDRAKIANPEQFFLFHKEKLICLDEIQRVPELFSSLRSIIDMDRRPGRFIILGSASRDLIRQSSESLAGRIGYLELGPFICPEISGHGSNNTLWIQGGFPESYLSSQRKSNIWRTNYIRTYLERDIPQIGFSVPAEMIRRLWKMLAHNHGQLLNLSVLGRSLGTSHTTVRKYLDILNQTFMTRELAPFEANLGKRLVKSGKIYIRDTGVLHSLLDISDYDELMSHPVHGFSWEGFVLENICTYLADYEAFFYRTAQGAELDLVLRKGNRTLAFEFKVADAPKPTRGFWQAIQDIRPDLTYIVSPLAGKYPIEEYVWVIGLGDLFKELKQFRSQGLFNLHFDQP